MKASARFGSDFYGAALLVTIGLATTFGGTRYPIGSLDDMGPGYFPTAVGIALTVVGLLIALAGSVRAGDDGLEAPDWRGWAGIIGGMLAFVVLGEYGGLVPASFAIVFLSALGDRSNTVLQAAVLAIAMTIICALVFWWGLKLQLPLFRWG